HGGGESSADPFARARGELPEALLVCDRRGQGAAGGDHGSLWGRTGRATLPDAQAAQRAGGVADRAARASAFVAAGGLQIGTGRRGNRQDGKDGPVAGAGLSFGGAQLA